MIAINVFIIYQSCLPAKSSKEWSEVVVVVIQDISGGSVTPSTKVSGDLTFSEFIRKAIGHFTLFGLNGVITFFYFYFLNMERKFKRSWLYLVLTASVGILIASITEIIQLSIPGRAGDVIDVLLDVAGFIVAASICYLIIYLINKNRKKKEEERVE